MQNRCSTAQMMGRPNTAIGRLIQPLGSLFTPQWVTIISGNLSHSTTPTTIGSRMRITVKIIVFL